MTDNEPFPKWMVPNGTTWSIVDFGGEGTSWSCRSYVRACLRGTAN